jgi:dolichol-phosphate mannosyltransferase
MPPKFARSDFHEDKPLISVVVPLFNEETNLPELYRRLAAALERDGERFELIFVNDGSQDDTPHLLERLHRQDRRVVAVHLSRNFGHQAAISAGIDLARGQAVILMDGDLQDPPEVLGQFLETWRQGFEVVYAIRTKRKEGLLKRLAYAAFYRVLRAVSDLDLPLDSGDFCLMDRVVVDTLKKMPERTRFVRGLRSFAGYRQRGIRYERAARNAGRPKYTFRALVRLAFDGLVGFSSFPLALIGYLGFFTLAAALLAGGFLAVDGLFRQQAPAGWSVTLLAVLLVGSLNLLSLGIVGQYVRRIFLETKGRPTYIVASLRQREAPEVLQALKRVSADMATQSSQE